MIAHPETSPTLRPYRRIMVVIFLVVIAIGQIASIVRDSNHYWPFSRIKVFSRLTLNRVAHTKGMVAMTPEGEINVASIGPTNFRIVWSYIDSWLAAETEDRKHVILQRFLEYLNRHNPDEIDIQGFRFYDFTWDLDQGEIANRKLLAEHLIRQP